MNDKIKELYIQTIQINMPVEEKKNNEFNIQ